MMVIRNVDGVLCTYLVSHHGVFLCARVAQIFRGIEVETSRGKQLRNYNTLGL